MITADWWGSEGMIGGGEGGWGKDMKEGACEDPGLIGK